jgi:hypothetical protein
MICADHGVQCAALRCVQGSDVCDCAHVQQGDVWGPASGASHEGHVGRLHVKVQLHRAQTAGAMTELPQLLQKKCSVDLPALATAQLSHSAWA